jgi:hypothetical protein
MDDHSFERTLEISPVRSAAFVAEISGRRLRAKIMNAFIGRLGVPSALSVCAVSGAVGSSAGRAA